MFISLFPTPFGHFHFHPTLGLDPALILTLRRKTHFDRVDQFVFRKLRKLTQKRKIEILVEGYDLEN